MVGNAGKVVGHSNLQSAQKTVMHLVQIDSEKGS